MDLTTPSLLWFISGIILLLLEMSVPGFILFFFGVGAWLTAIACLLYPLTLTSQLLLFTCSSLVALLTLRSFMNKIFSGSTASRDSDNALALPGEQVVVVNDILPPAEGKVKYSGTTWRARAKEKLYAGEMVEIVLQDGLIMEVKRLEDKELS